MDRRASNIVIRQRVDIDVSSMLNFIWIETSRFFRATRQIFTIQTCTIHVGALWRVEKIIC